MFGNLSDVIKIPAALIIGMALSALVLVITYEGISLPLIGQVINGRLQNAVKDATKDTVQKFRLDAALAQLDRERKDRATADQLKDEAQKRAQSSEQARSRAQADLDARIKTDTSADGAVWTQEDIDWFGKH